MLIARTEVSADSFYRAVQLIADLATDIGFSIQDHIAKIIARRRRRAIHMIQRGWRLHYWEDYYDD